MTEVHISVVIPAYNRAKTIVYCLDSVCNQTVPPDEIIVVDDCSTDTTVETVNNYSLTHPLVRCVVLERNAGAQVARNRGIAEAKSEWIAFQDSDDEWLSDKLEKQIAVLRTENLDPMTVLHTDCFRFDHQTLVKKLWALRHINGKNVLPDLLVSPGPMFQGMLTTRLALERIGFLDEKVPSYQEWDTSILLARVCRFIHIREPLFVYHLHAADTISKNMKKDVEGFQYVVDKHSEEIIAVCGADELDKLMEKNAYKAMTCGLYADARQILSKTIGNSSRLKLLRFFAKYKIKLKWLNLVSRIGHRLKVL